MMASKTALREYWTSGPNDEPGARYYLYTNDGTRESYATLAELERRIAELRRRGYRPA